MIQEPIAFRNKSQLIVVDRRTHHPGGSLTFWGGLLLAVGLVMVVVFPDFREFTDPVNMMVPTLMGVVGSGMLLFGGKASRKAIELAAVNVLDANLRILPEASPQLGGKEVNIPFERIQAVVYGMTMFPMEEGSRTDVEAYSVCVETAEGGIVPLVEATTNKLASYRVATEVAAVLGVTLRQVGIGYE